MGADDLLILDYDEFASGVEKLYHELDSSPAFREYFSSNPASALHHTLFPEREPIDESLISYGNRLLFALLSNPKFERWSRDYSVKLEARFRVSDDPETLKQAVLGLDREELYRDVVSGIQENGDLETFYALLTAPRGRAKIPATYGDFWSHSRRKDPFGDADIQVQRSMRALWNSEQSQVKGATVGGNDASSY
jgi:hypothetical protein